MATGKTPEGRRHREDATGKTPRDPTALEALVSLLSLVTGIGVSIAFYGLDPSAVVADKGGADDDGVVPTKT